MKVFLSWWVPVVFCLLPFQAAEAAWVDWWQTPEQRALRAFEDGDHETLINDAPDADWKALGQFQSGDYDAASASFAERAEQLQRDGQPDAAIRARYNQGVSDVQAGRYQQAINRFDSVLESVPGHADAAHNRAIAEQLLELQKQQGESPQSPGDQQGEQSGEQQDGQQGDQSGQQPGDQNAAQDESQGDRQSDTGSDDESARQDESDAGNDARNESRAADDSTLPGQSEEERQAAAEQARQALAAEAARETEEASEGGEIPDSGQSGSAERPLSESEQATEQLLRRIPDDPTGLLRRKLEQSHLNEYPEVRDAPESW